MLLQQVPKVQDRRLVRQRARQPQTREAPHRLHLVQQILHPRIAQVCRTTARSESAASQTTHTAADPAPPSDTTARCDAPVAPRSQIVHPRRKLLAPRAPLLRMVLQLRKRRLFHPAHRLPANVRHYLKSDLFRLSLVRLAPARRGTREGRRQLPAAGQRSSSPPLNTNDKPQSAPPSQHPPSPAIPASPP